MTKKHFLLSIIILITGLFAISSCSKDDDKEEKLNVNRADLVGKWINTKIEWDESGETESITFNNANRYMVLDNDGTGYVSPYNLFEDEKRDGFKWSISGNKFITKEDNGDVDEYIVIKLTATELCLRWVDYDSDDDYFIETHTFVRATNTDY